MGKAQDQPSMEFGKCQKFKGAHSESKETKRKSTLSNWWTYVTSSGGGTKITKVQRQSRAPWGHFKKRLAYTVFTEADSIASQMTRAQVMDVKARLPDCDGQTVDAVISDIQLNVQDAAKLLKIPKSEGTDMWTRFSLSDIEDPIVPLEGNLYELPLSWSTFSRYSNKSWMYEVRNWWCLFVHR